MAIPVISLIPQPPTTSDPENFSARADSFLAVLPVFQQQLNAVIGALNPLVPDLPGLDKIVKNLEAIRVTGDNITSVNATGTGIRSVNTVASVSNSGALQKVADANAAIRALSPVALELAELAAHIAELSAISDKLVQIQAAVSQLETITTATANIAELVALGANMPAVLGVYANLDSVKKAPSAATQTQADVRAAAEAKRLAEAARDAAQGFANAAAGISGLPIGTENGAPMVWNSTTRRWVQGVRVSLATADTPGLATGDGKTIVIEKGILSVPSATADTPGILQADGTTLAVHGGVVGIKPEVTATPKAGAIPLRNAQGNLEGNVTGTATPLAHVATHAQNGPDALTLEAMGYRVSIPGAPDSLVKRNAQGKIEGALATPQAPSTHAASHQQDGSDPVSLEALGVTISIAPPSGTFARLWVQYF